MDELDRFKSAWRDAHVHADPAASARDALPAIRARVLRLRRTIVARDRRETWTGVTAALLFVVFAVRATAALPRIGYAVSIAATAVIVWRLRRARNAANERATDVSVLAFCRAERANVDDQIQLLRTVLWWYLAPLMVGVNLVVFGLAGIRPLTLLFLVATLLLSAVVYWANIRAVTRQLMPLRDELDRLVAEFEMNEA
jgi:hypothetical protein